MTFLYPEAFLLVIPLAWVWWKYAGRSPWRAAVLLLGVVVLSVPVIVKTTEGADVVIVVDRSSSMPAESAASVDEIVRLVEKQRGRNDRVGIVTFGSSARVERAPDERATFAAFEKVVDRDGSDLDAGLRLALDLVPKDRAARFLVLSDGEYVGPDPAGPADIAGGRGIPIDHRSFVRPGTSDVAVDSIDLPLSLRRLEAFQFTAWVSSTHAKSASYELLRGTEPVAKGDVELIVGRNRLIFRDRPPVSGMVEYTLRLRSGEDRIPENDQGRAVVEVTGEGSILLLTHDGKPGNLAAALKSGGRNVEVASSRGGLPGLDALAQHRAVVFENVAALDVGGTGLVALQRYIEELGGGFMMTGGRRSFGNGGYRKTPFEAVLPVALESKKEKRRLNSAIAFVLDRSGSMSAPAGSGATKMDLANAGTVAGIELMSATDEVAVIAVDSSPHVVQELAKFGECPSVIEDVRAIDAGGGGIFTYPALVAAGEQLLDSKASTRHIMLFADAADAEEPGKYVELIAQYTAAGIGVSVIALGTESDKDAEFLKDVARLGGGKIYFTTDAMQLPQLFSLETMTVMKAAFVEAPTEITQTSDLFQMSSFSESSWPGIDGYNLTELKSGALSGLQTVDENTAPIVAWWQRGLGRVVACPMEVDGRYSGSLATWPRYESFFATLGNWIVNDGGTGALAATARRDGHHVTATLEVDPEAPDEAPKKPPVLVVVPADVDQPVERIPMSKSGTTTYAARYELASGATAHHRVEVDGRVVRANPVTLPYSPEYESRVGLRAGKDALAEISSRSEGRERLDVSDIFDRLARGSRYVSLAVPLAILWLCLVVFEIAQRRLGLAIGSLGGWMFKRSTKADGKSISSSATAPGQSVVSTRPTTSTDSSGDARRAAELEKRGDVKDTLSKAKERARRRF